ncbi:hypothetical protein FVE85_8584 [Porphyridium purpureum]|uniref:DUF3291 domain-containing protein n=1 Tax=Porphyridium purpureum TaxID=35688 RepID=A0A5J4YNY5_PORPP|nr:hypothetical protein FVE85_8584 [Porphyridium purpureum]|eukprot:POR4630..scf296_7
MMELVAQSPLGVGAGVAVAACASSWIAYRIWEWRASAGHLPDRKKLKAGPQPRAAYGPLLLVKPWETVETAASAPDTLILVHTSFTVWSVLELAPFFYFAGKVMKEVSQAPGCVGSSACRSSRHLRGPLDTLSAWESVEALKTFYGSRTHGGIVQRFWNGKQFHKSPHYSTQRLSISRDDLPRAGDYTSTVQFWERVLAGEYLAFAPAQAPPAL